MSKQSQKLDLNQLAKRIVDEATDETMPEEIDEKKKAALDKKRLCNSKNNKVADNKD